MLRPACPSSLPALLSGPAALPAPAISGGATSLSGNLPPDHLTPVPMRFILTCALLALPLHAVPLVVAHRGASGDAPENTLPAFDLAWKQKADAIEGDFRLTADGHIVCLHDADTGRVAVRKLVVSESTLAALRTLDVGSWKGPGWKGTRIPTLAEVLATIPDGKRIYIEIKCGPEIIPPLLKTLEGSGLDSSQIVVICFDAEVIKGLKAAAPRYELNWLCAFKRRDGRDSPSRDFVLRTLTQCGADGLGTNAFPAIDAGFVARVRALGANYHVWTINDAATARRFRDLGTDSITTDLPALIRRALRRE